MSTSGGTSGGGVSPFSPVANPITGSTLASWEMAVCWLNANNNYTLPANPNVGDKCAILLASYSCDGSFTANAGQKIMGANNNVIGSAANTPNLVNSVTNSGGDASYPVYMEVVFLGTVDGQPTWGVSAVTSDDMNAGQTIKGIFNALGAIYFARSTGLTNHNANYNIQVTDFAQKCIGSIARTWTTPGAAGSPYTAEAGQVLMIENFSTQPLTITAATSIDFPVIPAKCQAILWSYATGQWMTLSTVGYSNTSLVTASTPGLSPGTALQVDNNGDCMLYLQLSAGTAVSVAIGPTATPANTLYSGLSAATTPALPGIRVPAGWYVEVSGTGVTISAQTLVPC